MRFSTLVCLGIAAVLLTGCKETKIVNSFVPIGQACPAGTTCVAGASCLDGVCTTGCQTTADCWGASECRPFGDNGDLTCIVPRFIKGAAQPGTSCAVDANACAADPQCDPLGNCSQTCASDDECSPSYSCSPDFNVCMRQLICYSRRLDDPDAFCTQGCVDDLDCPATLYCEYVASETNPDRKLCVRRQFCAPCTFDSDCDLLGGVCATDDRGLKFCSNECTPPIDPITVPALPLWCTQDPDHPLDDECRKADPRFRCQYTDWSRSTGWLTGSCIDPNVSMCPQPFSVCKDNGAGRNLCYHRYGTCVGDGSACAPCRSPKDCDSANGALCYRNRFSLERFCTVTCDTTCADSSFACFEFVNDCTKDADCYGPGATCDLATGQCTPKNPNECIKSFDWGCVENADLPYGNPKYPTCYQSVAGDACYPIG